MFSGCTGNGKLGEVTERTFMGGFIEGAFGLPIRIQYAGTGAATIALTDMAVKTEGKLGHEVF